MKKGEIAVTPFEPKNFGALSLDLRLGNEFRVFRGKRRFVVTEDAYFSDAFQRSTKVVKADGGLLLAPGQLVLGATQERIKLSKNVCATLEGRSRFARMGLMVHVSSSLVQPGVDNVQVLEILNVSPFELVVKPGVKICQIRFELVEDGEKYRGTFQNQTSV